MKKITSFVAIIALTLVSYTANAQYYVNTYTSIGQNPGGLNNDAEFPVGGGLPAGWSTIFTGSSNTSMSPSWTANQTVPFSFQFNGSSVTSYKISTNGLITFDLAATTNPTDNNSSLPSTSIPDNSVVIWGLYAANNTDFIVSKTFGTTPNRQHWINFNSYSTSGAGWSYWSIVLEETTNKIYVVDQRTNTGPISLTVGIQINDSTATQVSSSPNVISNSTNDPSVVDNSYFEFIPGTRPVRDVALTSLDNGNTFSALGTTISGEIYNNGSETITSVEVNWSTDGGVTINTDTLSLNLATNVSTNFTHSDVWNPSNPGNFETIDVWLSNPNNGTDENVSNDSISRTGFVSTGNTVQRKVLLEEFTTAVCQFCPDGTVVVNRITDNNPNVIAVGVHSCFGTDAMTNADASTICSTLGNNSAPTAMIDRVKFDGDAEPAHSRGLWEQRANDRSLVGSPVSVDITGSYDENTRSINVDVDAIFVDALFPGNGTINISLLVLEDSVVGTGNGYNQVNAYNNSAGHPYQGAGNPIVGFPHRHVLRDILPTTWGDATVIPSTITLNNTYTRNFTFQLDNNWDDKQVSLVAIVNRQGPTNADYEVLNAESIKLSSIQTIVGLDAALLNLDISNSAKESSTVDISGKILNRGTDTITSVLINWSADSGITVFTDTLSLNLVTANDISFTHSATWTATNIDDLVKIDVWVSEPNNGVDLNLSNDTLSQIVLVTGLNKTVLNAKNLKIYPNPSANQANLQFELTQNERVEVEILDITGKILRKENYGVRPTGSQLIQLNTSEFSNGFYFVKVIVGDSQITKKITVIK